MADPVWPGSPPEVNYLRLVGAGAAGTATTLASAAAWQSLVASDELAFSLSTMNTVVTGLNFDGVGGASSRAAVTGLNAALQLLAGWAQEKPPVLSDAVSTYQTAVAAMIPAELCLANRAEQAADVAINPLVLGALTPAIVALDTEYFGEYWPHNASTGVAYGSALGALAATLAVPPPLSPPGASPAAPATAAVAVAQTAGRLAAGETPRDSTEILSGASDTAAEGAGTPAAMAGGVSQLGSLLTQPLQSAGGMFQYPMQALSGAMGLPQSLLGGFTGGMSPAAEGDEEAWPSYGAMSEGFLPVPVPGGAGTGAGVPRGPAASVPSAITLPGGGITSYTAPPTGFVPEVGGRPVARTGLLSAEAEVRGPMVTASSGAVPIPGKAAPSDQKHANAVVAQARVVLEGAHPQG